MTWLLLVLFAYLLGSIPTGVVVARILGGVDPRGAGSGNIGATNVGRTLGHAAGAVTLAGDALKGFIPAAWAVAIFPDAPWAVATVAFAAFAGHVFPLYLGFRGGKGVATGLGVFLAVAPGSALVAAGVFAAVAWKVRIVSLASLGSAAALPLLLAFFDHPGAMVTLGLAVAGLVGWKHEDNFQRLLAGTEARMGRR